MLERAPNFMKIVSFLLVNEYLRTHSSTSVAVSVETVLADVEATELQKFGLANYRSSRVQQGMT